MIILRMIVIVSLSAVFNAVFRYYDYRKFILMRNEHGIQSHHKKLHRISYIISDRIRSLRTT